MAETKATKPLGRKNYGSIGHLPNSRIGPGDHHVHAGQAVICCEKVRDHHDRIIVTEKLDGSNVGIAKIDGQVIALGRAGYLAQTSKYEQHQFFAHWVRTQYERFDSVLADGERIVGEWLSQAHGTRYTLPHEPFVVFDLMVAEKRLPYDQLIERAKTVNLTTPRILHDDGPISVEAILVMIAESGHGAIDDVEGAVWRVERSGKFDFMAKYVRPEKKDGSYLPEVSGNEAIWNWRP